MSGISLELKLEGYPALQGKLNKLIQRTANLRPLMQDIGAYLDYSTRSRFLTQRGPDGTPWLPSARALREGGKTLIKTARLMGSFSYKADARSVEEGTNVIYAAIHHFGGVIKRKARTQTIYRKVTAGEISDRFVKRSKSNFATDHAVGAHDIEMPARPILGVNDNDEREIMNIVDDYLMRGIA